MENRVIKYVFFDLGLTLVENSMPKRYRKAMSASGFDISEEQAAEVYHLANKFFMRERQGELGKGNRKCFVDYVTCVCKLAGDETKALQVIGHLEKMEKPVWKAFDYTVEVLEELKKHGVGLGLISNWDSTCRDVLAENGLDKLLDVIVVSSEENVEKPEASIFEKAIALAEINPWECIYVGDNYYDDAVGSAKLGIESFIINSPDYFGIEELKGKNVNIISDIREIPVKIGLHN
ncbi:MAG: HAD-IA family hydrolase [Lachnospiraceae bacterium]|nr:HAD-IA family hydrolase [Lachnospiraceae bacterium]